MKKIKFALNLLFSIVMVGIIIFSNLVGSKLDECCSTGPFVYSVPVILLVLQTAFLLREKLHHYVLANLGLLMLLPLGLYYIVALIFFDDGGGETLYGLLLVFFGPAFLAIIITQIFIWIILCAKYLQQKYKPKEYEKAAFAKYK
jgi:hypothetical protein